MATSARPTARKQQKKSDSDVPPSAGEFPEGVLAVESFRQGGEVGYTVRLKPGEFDRLVESVSFDQLFAEATGSLKKKTPPYYYLWSFLKSQAIERLENFHLQADRAWALERSLIVAIHRHIKVPLVPMIEEARIEAYTVQEEVDLFGSLVEVKDTRYRFVREVSYGKYLGYDFYLLSVPKVRDGQETVTAEMLNDLMAEVHTKASPQRAAKKRTPVLTVLYRTLVWLAYKEGKQREISQLVKFSDFNDYPGDPSQEVIRNARDELTKLISKIIRDVNRRVSE